MNVSTLIQSLAEVSISADRKNVNEVYTQVCGRHKSANVSHSFSHSSPRNQAGSLRARRGRTS